ncbi:MAG: DUF3429 domain-containing protein [Pseudomonadota bacterium]
MNKGLNLGILHPDTNAFTYNIAYIQIAYGGFIASFLAGIHWFPSIKTENKLQMLLAMVPSIAFLGLLLGALTTSLVAETLIAAGLIFPLIYIADLKFFNLAKIDAGYINFRLTITIIVALSFIISAIKLI